MTSTPPDLVPLYGLPFGEAHGGTGTGALMLCVAIDEAKASASSALPRVVIAGAVRA